MLWDYFSPMLKVNMSNPKKSCCLYVSGAVCSMNKGTLTEIKFHQNHLGVGTMKVSPYSFWERCKKPTNNWERPVGSLACGRNKNTCLCRFENGRISWQIPLWGSGTFFTSKCSKSFTLAKPMASCSATYAHWIELKEKAESIKIIGEIPTLTTWCIYFPDLLLMVHKSG